MFIPENKLLLKNSSDEHYVETKEQLEEVLYSLENDHLVMYSRKDGNVILI